jgi:hypothetical protein
MDRIRYLIGLVTLATAGVLGFVLFQLLADENPDGYFPIRLEFADVRGLGPGAEVRFRGVRVGSVREIGLSPDGEKGVITILLESDHAELARVSSMFWVVSPRFGGLAGGATGLDTLVRDSYVAFLTPQGDSPPLARSSLVVGREVPPAELDVPEVRQLERGDLRMTVLSPERHGLQIGAPVRLRGCDIGEVRNVELSSDATHIRVELGIREAFRRSVTEGTVFWIARPRVSGAILSGITVEDLGALLEPFVGLRTLEPIGAPVVDGHIAVAAESRPDFEEELSDLADVAGRPAIVATGPDTGPSLVEVVYEAEERDWLSANDEVRRRGTGLLFVDRGGRTVVVTARSLCDASTIFEDFLSDPDVIREAIRVVVPGVGVLRAGRSWVDPAGADLAVLVLENAPPDLRVTNPSEIGFETPVAEAPPLFRTVGNEGASPANVAEMDLEVCRGSIALRDGLVVGIVGEADGQPTMVPLTRLPEALRPGR